MWLPNMYLEISYDIDSLYLIFLTFIQGHVKVKRSTLRYIFLLINIIIILFKNETWHYIYSFNYNLHFVNRVTNFKFWFKRKKKSREVVDVWKGRDLFSIFFFLAIYKVKISKKIIIKIKEIIFYSFFLLNIYCF